MLGALVAAAAVLLAAAGLAKTVAPEPAARMLAATVAPLRGRRPALVPTMRVAGVLEAALGVAVVLLGGRLTAALLCVTYLIFTAVALRLLRSGPAVSCGCFGRADTPVGVPHLVVDVVCAVLAAAAVVSPTGRFAGLTGHGALTLVVGALQVVLLAWAAYLAITALPALTSARRQVETP